MNIVNILKLKSIDEKLCPIILEKLYLSIDFSISRYEMLKSEDQLEKIKNNKGVITVQFQGIAFLIFFCTIDNKKYNLLISKRELKSELKRNNIRDIKIYSIFLQYVKPEYYSGTILDGKIIKTEKMSHSFVIHEIYGNIFTTMDISDKYNIIDNDFIPNLSKFTNKIDFKIARLYEYSELPSLLFDKITKSQFKIIGLMFLSRISQSYYVYTDEPEFIALKDKKPLIYKKTYTDSIVEFKMKSTLNIDVYFLHDKETDVKVGIAHIPDIKTSHFFKNIFTDQKETIVKCIRSDKFNKWVPICDEFMDYANDIF